MGIKEQYFAALHLHLSGAYLHSNCGCESCNKITLAAKNNKNIFDKVKNAADAAYQHLHSTGKYNPKDLSTEKPYIDLMNATRDVFNTAIQDNVMPDEMLSSLQNDAFVFSGLKTHAQLLEVSGLLLTKENKTKPFAHFAQEVLKINEAYNVNYLEAEYQFATSSAQMAAKWANLDPDGDRYMLQYRTAQDERVRESHQVLHNITLPTADDFWSKYYPPNGWRCRCTAVQVRSGKFEVSDSEKASSLADRATTEIGKDGKNKLEMFRFNSGKDKVLMPPKNAYTKVVGASQAKKAVEELAKKEESKPKFAPANISDYEKSVNAKIKPEIFEYLTKETPLVLNKKGGAYYQPGENKVYIPLDERREKSKWYAQAVIYHEFGHAADFHVRMSYNSKVTDLMDKHRKIFKKNDNEQYKQIDDRLKKLSTNANKKKQHDIREKAGAALDTLMSLNPRFGYGHSVAYFKRQGMKQAEFIAHAFENTFAGNEVFKKVMPELYSDMVELIKELKPKQE